MTTDVAENTENTEVAEDTIKVTPEVVLTPETSPSEKAQELQAQKFMLDSALNIKEVVEDFILITFDIPVTDEGNKARAEFYHNARRIGAVMHTESVYYMPWTQAANVTALNLAEAGKVFVWFTKTSGNIARELTMRYDIILRKWIDEIDERLDKILSHIREGKVKLARNMLERTVTTLVEMDEIVKRRNSATLAKDIASLRASLKPVLEALISAEYSKLVR